MKGDRSRWDERYRSGEFELPAEPSPSVRVFVDDLPGGHPFEGSQGHTLDDHRGRALDVATGTGRNAVFLAENGFEVDAVDVSREALTRARARAADHSVTVAWIQADVDSYPFPAGRYDVVSIALFDVRDRLPDLKDALAPGGVLVYDHVLRTPGPNEHGPSNRYRFEPRELREACSDLTVLRYVEHPEEDRPRVELVARKE